MVRAWEGVTARSVRQALLDDAASRAAELGLAALQAFGTSALPVYRRTLAGESPAPASCLAVVDSMEDVDLFGIDDGHAPQSLPQPTPASTVLDRIASFLG